MDYSSYRRKELDKTEQLKSLACGHSCGPSGISALSYVSAENLQSASRYKLPIGLEPLSC